jgi:hypothetical protein
MPTEIQHKRFTNKLDCNLLSNRSCYTWIYQSISACEKVKERIYNRPEYFQI